MPSQFSSDIKLSAVSWPAAGAPQRGGAGALQPGQVIRARVEQVQPGGTVILRFGDLTLPVMTQLSLSRGQELLLKMTSAEPRASFSILRVVSAQEPTRREPAAPVASEPGSPGRQIQALVSKQLPASTLLRFLQLPAEHGSLAPSVAAQWGAYSKQWPVPQDLVHPEKLLRALTDSGLLMEAKLARLPGAGNAANSASSLLGDLKLALWQFLAIGTPVQAQVALPPEVRNLRDKLRRLVEGVSAQISLRQLHAVNQAEAGNFHWSMELPLMLGGQFCPLSVTISGERALAQQQAEDSWQVELEIDLEPLGPLLVSLYVRDQRVSVSLQAQRESAVEALHAGLSDLETTLQEQGFNVEALLSRPMSDTPRKSELAEFHHLLAVSA
jgi:hypothetical protein